MRGFALTPTLATAAEGWMVIWQPVMDKAPPRST